MPANQFNRNFDLAFENGQEFEDFLRGLIANGKIECKDDQRARETGNLFIEYECRGKPSGLTTTEADWWFICIRSADKDIERVVGISVPWLKAKLRTNWKRYSKTRGGDDGLSMGILFPIADIKTDD